MMRSKRSVWLDTAACIALMLLTWIVFRKIVRLWWLFDDPHHLNFIEHAGAWALLSDRAVYVQWATPLFTPLLLLSLKLDLALFGPDASAFYAHQLVACMTFAAVQYLTLRLWCSRLTSWTASAITLLGVPVMYVAPLLMARHYIEGGVLAMLSTLFAVRALRSRHAWAFALLSGACYFLAASAKEIFILLPLLLLAMPEGSVRRRIQLLLPHAIAGLAYAAWRVAMVGANVGSYGFVERPSERTVMFLSLPLRTIQQFAGHADFVADALVALIILCVLLIAVRLPAARLPIAAGFLIALLPILPVATQLQPRWSFPLWLLAASCVAFLSRALPPRAQVAACAVLLGLAVVTYRIEWPPVYSRDLQMSREARAFGSFTANDILLSPETPPVTLTELAQLEGAHGRAVYDFYLPCHGSQLDGNLFDYDARHRQIHRVNGDVVKQACRRIREAPLQVRIFFEERGSFFWKLGPYRNGTYSFVLGGDRQRYEVVPEGGFRSPSLPGLTIRVRYDSPEGWTTYSPELQVDMVEQTPVSFTRS
jgi:hypothetical protein